MSYIFTCKIKVWQVGKKMNQFWNLKRYESNTKELQYATNKILLLNAVVFFCLLVRQKRMEKDEKDKTDKLGLLKKKKDKVVSRGNHL